MRIKSITIELEMEKTEEGIKHATLLHFEHGTWDNNGPVFPRIAIALGEIPKMVDGKTARLLR